jgi:CubicO group peptidase (beta-lactamase class C family)
MKRTALIVGLLVLAVVELLPSPPDRFGPARAFIQEKMKKEGLPSLAVAVAQNGQIIWEEAWGLANIEKQIPATPQTMYSLASTTKPITATALMLLVERGLVDLDKPANLYLGEGRLTGYKPEAATVRRLLRHTAGLPLHWNLIFADEEYERPDMDETIRRYGILVSPPGEGFSYSNLGYGVLERIIERVSQKSYADFLKSEVFAPLGMTRSAVLLEPGPEADVAQRYTQQQKPFPFFDFDHRGASAAYASAHDLVRFGMFHLGNHLPDQKQILSAKLIAAMQRENRPGAPESSGSMGWSSYRVSGIHFVSHSGGMFGVGARLTLLPEKNTACVVLTNAATGMQGTDLWDVEWEILKAVVTGFPDAPARPAPPAAAAVFVPPDSLAGIWQGKVRADGGDLPAKLTVEKAGQVRLELAGQESVALTVPTPLGSLRFRDGVLLAQFMASLKTADTARAPHILLLGVKLRGDKMDGALSAVAMNQRFCYSHWIELSRFQKGKIAN